MTADLIISNARSLTMDDMKPRTEAIATKDGRILAVGTNASIGALGDRSTEVIDGHGATLLPGFFQSHCHLFMGGAELAHLQLGRMTGFAAVSRAVLDFASANPRCPMLMAQGAD